MNDRSVAYVSHINQLMLLNIDLVYKVRALFDCCPEVLANPHAAKASQLAEQWHETFVDLIASKEGAI